MRMINVLVIISLYKFWGINVVIIYSVLNIDAHLDEIAESINQIILKQPKGQERENQQKPYENITRLP